MGSESQSQTQKAPSLQRDEWMRMTKVPAHFSVTVFSLHDYDDDDDGDDGDENENEEIVCRHNQ